MIINCSRILIARLLRILTRGLHTYTRQFIERGRQSLKRRHARHHQLTTKHHARIRRTRQLICRVTRRVISRRQQHLLRMMHANIRRQIRHRIESALRMTSYHQAPQRTTILRLIDRITPILFRQVRPRTYQHIIIIRHHHRPVMRVITRRQACLLFRIL